MAERKRVFHGDRLKQVRNERQLSQEDLARRLGFSHSQLNRYENGRADPSPDVITRLVKELDTTSDYLLGLSDDPHAFSGPRELNPEERKMVLALRRDDLDAALEILRQRIREHLPNKSTISGSNPPANK